MCLGGILSNAYLSARGVGLISYIIPNLKKCTLRPPLCEIYTEFFLFPHNLGHVQQNITPLKKVQFKSKPIKIIKN